MNGSHASLRHAAILLSSLPAPTVEGLLGTMDDPSAAKLRNAVGDLDLVPPDERCQVIEDFLAEFEAQSDRDHGNAPAASAETLDQPKKSRTTAIAPSDSVTNPPRFAFLHDTSAERLTDLLGGEQPQTVAVVVAHLPAQRAVALMQRLPPALRTEVLCRVAAFDEVDPDAIRVIEQEMETLLAGPHETVAVPPVGLTTVQAILAAAGDQQRGQWIADVSRADGSLAEHLDQGRPYLELPISAHRGDRSGGSAKAPENRGDRLPIETLALQTRKVLTEDKALVPEHPPPRLLGFADLEHLDDASLARVLQDCEPHTILLAMACARRTLVARLLNQVPASESRELQKRLRSLGPLLLSDVETSQQRLAQAANELASRGEISVHMQRSLSTTA